MMALPPRLWSLVSSPTCISNFLQRHQLHDRRKDMVSMVENDLTVKGFRAAAVEAGIRYKKRLDLGLIVS